MSLWFHKLKSRDGVWGDPYNIFHKRKILDFLRRKTCHRLEFLQSVPWHLDTHSLTPFREYLRSFSSTHGACPRVFRYTSTLDYVFLRFPSGRTSTVVREAGSRVEGTGDHYNGQRLWRTPAWKNQSKSRRSSSIWTLAHLKSRDASSN